MTHEAIKQAAAVLQAARKAQRAAEDDLRAALIEHAMPYQPGAIIEVTRRRYGHKAPTVTTYLVSHGTIDSRYLDENTSVALACYRRNAGGDWGTALHVVHIFHSDDVKQVGCTCATCLRWSTLPVLRGLNI